MVCYETVCSRALRELGTKLPLDGFSDEEIRKDLAVETHEELHAKVDNMSPDEFKRLVEYLLWKIALRRKKELELTTYIH